MEEEGWLAAGVSAALARAYTEHQREFIDSLASLLESALPQQVQVVRKRSLLSKARPVTELRLDLGDLRYTLESPRQGAPVARRVLVKRGIVLRTEEVPVPEWIRDVGAALEEHAQRHEDAAAALRRFIG
ncbi:MAG: hypothetical protein K0Q72_3486 [Armatimonadetes bacterium]|jgi:hypothetical protein|nr:hypothetical protein [Armatimonadota bacterium]